MLHKIYANNDNCKIIELVSGLNIIVANKTLTSTVKDSTNGTGKTSIINVIDFCLGAEHNKNSFFSNNFFSEWEFTLEATIGNNYLIITRSTQKADIVKIKGNISKFSVKPQSSSNNVHIYSIPDWRKLLGIYLFGQTETTPSYRELIHFFVRPRDDSYDNPFETVKKLKALNNHVNVAYIFGLDYKAIISIDELKKKQTLLTGYLQYIKHQFNAESKGELITEKALIESSIHNLSQTIQSFKINPKYQETQSKTNELTKKIHEAVNEKNFLSLKLSNYHNAIQEEHAPDISFFDELYKEAGYVFNKDIQKTLEEAKEFHFNIIKNRKLFLEAEINETTLKISNLTIEIKELDDERSSLMAFMRSHGALEEFTAIQKEFSEKANELARVQAAIENFEKYEQDIKKNTEALKIARERLENSYNLNQDTLNRLITLFNQNTEALYNTSGSLIINPHKDNYKFEIKIAKEKSDGISKMKVFCLSLILLEYFSSRGLIDFLVHDSKIFDGVDPRQIANALKLVVERSKKTNMQYLCFMNYNVFDEMKNINNAPYDATSYVRLQLSDENETGGFFGSSFN